MQKTDTEIALDAAAERIAISAGHIVLERNSTVLLDPAFLEIKRVAMNELREIDRRAYQIGVQHAVGFPESNIEACRLGPVEGVNPCTCKTECGITRERIVPDYDSDDYKRGYEHGWESGASWKHDEMIEKMKEMR